MGSKHLYYKKKKNFIKFVFLREGCGIYEIFINFCLILMNVYFPSILIIFFFQMKYLLNIQEIKRKTN